MNYLKRDIEKLIKGNNWLRSRVEEIDSIKKEQGTSYPTGIPNEVLSLEHRVMSNDYIIELSNYYVSKVEPIGESIKLGKYLVWSFWLSGNRISMSLQLSHDETHSKLYNYVFGSHSGINEWVQDHIVPLVSVILGDTSYSYAFGSWDLKNVSTFFDHFGKEYDNYNKRWDIYPTYKKEKYDEDLERAKKIINWLIDLSTKKELMEDIDRVLDTYFEVVFKHNKED